MLPIICTLITTSILLWELGTRSRVGAKLSLARICLSALFLRTTRVTIDASQLGHAVPINERMHLVRHASGRTAYLLLPRPLRPRPPMPRLVRAVLLTFFTL
jgi:hypothetical protein